MTWLVATAVMILPIAALLIAVRAVQQPDLDDFFDDPDDWGAV